MREEKGGRGRKEGKDGEEMEKEGEMVCRGRIGEREREGEGRDGGRSETEGGVRCRGRERKGKRRKGRRG